MGVSKRGSRFPDGEKKGNFGHRYLQRDNGLSLRNKKALPIEEFQGLTGIGINQISKVVMEKTKNMTPSLFDKISKYSLVPLLPGANYSFLLLFPLCLGLDICFAFSYDVPMLEAFEIGLTILFARSNRFGDEDSSSEMILWELSLPITGYDKQQVLELSSNIHWGVFERWDFGGTFTMQTILISNRLDLYEIIKTVRVPTPASRALFYRFNVLLSVEQAGLCYPFLRGLPEFEQDFSYICLLLNKLEGELNSEKLKKKL